METHESVHSEAPHPEGLQVAIERINIDKRVVMSSVSIITQRFLRNSRARVSPPIWGLAAAALGSAAGIVFGLQSLYGYNHSPHGYAAAYAYPGVFATSLCLAVVACPLLIWRLTRPLGFALFSAAWWLFFVFFIGIYASHQFGWVRWEHLPMVRIGPDVPADVVVYLRAGFSEAEATKTIDRLVHQQPGEAWRNSPQNEITTFLRLRSLEGHEGFCLTFRKDRSRQQRSRIAALFRESPDVYRVFESIAPNEVRTLK